MTPFDAAMREITLEMEALRARIGNGRLPESIDIRIELDRQSGMPRAVECRPEWRRHIQGGAVPRSTIMPLGGVIDGDRTRTERTINSRAATTPRSP